VGTEALAAQIAGLERDRPLLDRSSTAERVAAILRERVTEGMFQPGTRLSEEAVGEALNVSRNTLREAFRLLTHERLLVHELNRGVFVRTLTRHDVAEIYRLRRIVECAAMREAASTHVAAQRRTAQLAGLRRAVDDGERAAQESRWADVGTANIRFHQAVVGLADSAHLDAFMSRILAELRLAFYVMHNPRRFHEPYLGRNRELLTVLESGNWAAAEAVLREYLTDAEHQLAQAYGRAADDA
jgi:DNA-binding GntR family transcriptional regulator